MNNDDERDEMEEKYNREFCINCGESPCREVDDDCPKVWRRIRDNERETEAGFDSRSNH